MKESELLAVKILDFVDNEVSIHDESHLSCEGPIYYFSSEEYEYLVGLLHKLCGSFSNG